MPHWIEVPFQDKSGAFEPALSDLLAAIESAGSRLEWSIRFVEGTGDITDVWSGGIVDLEKTADESEEGVPVSWERISALARSVHQIIDGRFDGVGTEGVEIVIQAIDSTVWSLYARDPAVLDLVAAQYPPAKRGSIASLDEYLAGPGYWF